jgi:hypothetical protein
MYFLLLLFIIVLLKLYITSKYKVKEQFFFTDLINKQKNNNNVQSSRSPEYQNIINNYINQIKSKFEDLQEKRNIISSIKEESQKNIKQGNVMRNKNSRNKILLKK